MASDPKAPYARLAVVGLIRRDDDTGEARHGSEADCGSNAGEGRETGEGPKAEGPPDLDGRWLLLHRREPVDSWDPPGGRMEWGEDLTSAVVRELAEETGLAVQVAGPCYAFLTVYKGERLLAVSMACRLLGGSGTVRLEPDGAVEWQWVSAREWEGLAAEGRSSWDVNDIRKATRMAAVLWEAGSA